MVVTFSMLVLIIVFWMISAMVAFGQAFIHDQSVPLIALMDGLPAVLAVVELTSMRLEVFVDGVFFPSP